MATAAEINKLLPDIYPITPIQVMLYNDWAHRFIFCSSGRRSRKTLIFNRKLVIRALKKPGLYFCGAPVQWQAEDIFWPRLEKQTRLFWKRKPNKSKGIFYLKNDSEIHVIGLKEFTRIDGREQWDGCHVTEVDEIKEEAWTQHIRVVMADTGGFAYMDGVPEFGKKWYYKECVLASGGALPKRDEKLKGAVGINPAKPNYAYYHWYSRDVLPKEEIEDLKKTLDPKVFRLEFEGTFEDFLTAAYYQFGAHNLDRTIKYNPNLPVDVGMDFNVNPMTATFSHFLNGILYTFGEAVLPHSNTIAMIRHIKEDVFPGRSPSTITIFPDSTGGYETANADASSIALLRKAGFIINAPKANPRQKKRLNTTNAALLNMAGEVRWKINPDTCPKLVEGLNTTERKEDGTINKDNLTAINHNETDAASYNVIRRIPVNQTEIKSI